jgi:hypothetical protein
MDYLLSCECGREYNVSRSQAGQEIECECGKLLAVPTLRGMGSLPRAGQDSATPVSTFSPSPESVRTSWQGWRGPVMALSMAGFLIATAFCGWFSLQRWSIDTSYTEESEIEIGVSALNLADPNELSQIWEAFAKLGLRAKDPPDFFYWNRYAQQRERFAVTSGIVALAFGLLTLAVWWTSSKTPKKKVSLG